MDADADLFQPRHLGRAEFLGHLDDHAPVGLEVFGQGALMRRTAMETLVEAEVGLSGETGFAGPAGLGRLDGHELALLQAVLRRPVIPHPGRGLVSRHLRIDDPFGVHTTFHVVVQITATDADAGDLHQQFVFFRLRHRKLFQPDVLLAMNYDCTHVIDLQDFVAICVGTPTGGESRFPTAAIQAADGPKGR